MLSSEPDSSPICVICSTIDGKSPVLCIALVRLVPVLTSVWILRVPAANTALPEAPATASSDSTSGTPAANIVESVRVQRAIVAFSTMPPMIGSLSERRSIA